MRSAEELAEAVDPGGWSDLFLQRTRGFVNPLQYSADLTVGAFVRLVPLQSRGAPVFREVS